MHSSQGVNPRILRVWHTFGEGHQGTLPQRRAWKRAVLAGKELLQHRSQNSRNDIMGLTGEGAILSCGKSIGDCLRRLEHPCLDLAAAYHERGYRDGGHPFGECRHVAQKRRFIDERVRDVFERRPEWCLSQLGND
jgi:hypothetical protein